MNESLSFAGGGLPEVSERVSPHPDPIWSTFVSIHVLVPLVCILLCPNLISAQTLPAGFVNTTIGGYWPELAGFTFDDLGTMYAWERAGRVWILENDVKLPTPLIDIGEEVGAWDDHGLLGVALHPNFRQNGYIYLLYVVDHHYLTKFGTADYNPAASEYNRATVGRITRYTARASDGFHSVDPASRTILIGETASTGCPILNFSHGVGSLVFGQDGTLMATCGDGAGLSDAGSDPVSYYVDGLAEGILKPKENVGAFRSQMVDSLSGKVLRLDPQTGNGLSSNPYYDPGNPRAARSRVWTLGLRNPFRMTLRPGTGSHNPADGNPGEFTLGDVGYDTWEEADIVTGPRQNFGWPIFEGLEPAASYGSFDPANPDAPNPLYGTGGCTQQFFRFRDLIVQATLATPSWPNPCNASVQIPATTPRFMHTRPLMDWMHGAGPSRTGKFSGTTATVVNIGAAGSPLTGPQFGGNCSIGGTFYLGANFPSTYQNTYFFGDLGNGWIKNLTFDANNQPTGVRDFVTGLSGVVHMGVHPITGKMYYVQFYDGLFKLDYVGSGNQPPTAVATATPTYGPSPLAVQFTGSGSSDPEAHPLSYLWNFNDGSPISQSTAASPSHTFTAPAGVPTRYDVTLTVTDSGGATSTTTLIISPNNTPPNVAITSPVAGTLFPLTGDTTYNLTANVSDAEHANGTLAYQWQTILHHNNHEHVNPVDTNPVTTTVISPVGCDGNIYYWRILLKVTDPAGLFRQDEVDLYPDCAGGNTVPTISDTPNQTIVQGTSTGPIGFTVGDTETAVLNLIVTGASSNPALVPTGNVVFGGSGAARTVTVTPVAGQSGTATITLTVSDGQFSASDMFLLTVTAAANTAPTVSNLADLSTNEDTATSAIGFTVGDAETAAGNLVVTGASSNTTLVPTGNIVFGGSGAARTVTVTPAANQSGTATITVTVSDGALTASDPFVLTVTAVNDAPTISNIANQTIVVNASTGAIGFTIGDVETAGASLVVSGTSSNPTLVPAGNIVFGGSGTARTVTVTPAAGQSGTATITVTVSDGSLTASDPFLLTVNTVNTAPTISNIPNQTTNEDTVLGPIGFNVGDTDTPVESLTLTGTSSNTTRVPNSNIAFGGSAAIRTVMVTPAANQSGTATITVTVSDGSKTASDTFTLTVSAVNDTPTITDITDRTINKDTSTGAISFTVGDVEKAAANLTVTRSSSNTTLVPLANVVLGGSGANRTVTVTPAANQSGTATITVTVSDAVLTASDTFIVTVTPVNDAPTIANILDQTISSNASTGPIAFTVGDVETAAGSLTVTGASSNPTLVPTGNIVFGGSGANRTVTVTPAANQSGTATLTVSVNDGAASTSDTFVLTVTGTNTAPTISDITDRTMNEDTSTGAIAFTIGDAETAAGSLTVTRASSNTTLVPLANVVLGGSGASRTVTVTPAANLFGTATITVSVSDGGLTASDTFIVTVNPVNDPPTMTDIASQSIVQNTSTAALGFTIADLETAAVSLTLTGASSNQALVPDAGIVFGGSGSNRTVTVTPAASQTGTATITVTVSDGSLTGSDTFVLTVTNGTAPAYLLSESFEGPGFENAGWSLSGTPNPNYTTTTLEGLESLNTVGSQYIWRPFVNATTFSMYFQVRWNTWTSYTSVVSWDNSSWGAAAGIWAGANRLYISHGTTEATGTAPINANTTYHVWVEWAKGNGTDGTMALYVSTTGTKPAVADTTITAGKGVATARMYVGSSGGGPNIVFDRIRIAAVPIGSSP